MPDAQPGRDWRARLSRLWLYRRLRLSWWLLLGWAQPVQRVRREPVVTSIRTPSAAAGPGDKIAFSARVLLDPKMNPGEIMAITILPLEPFESWNDWVERCRSRAVRIVKITELPHA